MIVGNLTVMDSITFRVVRANVGLGIVVILSSTLSITVVLPCTTKGHSIGSYEEKEEGSIVINIHYLSEC